MAIAVRSFGDGRDREGTAGSALETSLGEVRRLSFKGSQSCGRLFS